MKHSEKHGPWGDMFGEPQHKMDAGDIGKKRDSHTYYNKPGKRSSFNSWRTTPDGMRYDSI